MRAGDCAVPDGLTVSDVRMALGISCREKCHPVRHSTAQECACDRLFQRLLQDRAGTVAFKDSTKEGT